MAEFSILSAHYTAVVTSRGAALRQLRHSGRDLVVSFPANGPIPDYRGIIAAPWPNRIEDGRYIFDGVRYQLPVNETARSSALHGLVFDEEWSLQDQDESWVTLACTLQPTPGYPFMLRITATYLVSNSGLTIHIETTNLGEHAAPYGLCPHPYLIAGPSPMAEWTMQFKADEFLEVTPDRLLPTATRTVNGHEFDFRTPHRIGTTMIDHAFTGVDFDHQGRSQLIIRDPAGIGVGMEWDRTCPWVQIHTADKRPPLPNRIGLAVEPMTCPPDAFNSEIDLFRLEPSATHEAMWRIFAL